MIKTKSVHTAIDRKDDGLRILVTRFRGRYMPTSRYDIWMANLGPSERLLREGAGNWAAFAREYKKEMLGGDEIERKNKTIRNCGQKFTLRLIKKLSKDGNVTLLCHCAEEAEHCHRHVLRRLIESRAI